MISTARTILRRFKLSDLDNMRKLESEIDIMEFTPSKVPQTPEQSLERLHRTVNREAELEPFGVWAAETKSGSFIGWFMLIKTDLHYPEIGFMIVKDYWGQGLTTEVARALIHYGINQLGANGISARTTADNVASIRVLEKLGFIFIEEKLNPAGDPIKFFEKKV